MIHDADVGVRKPPMMFERMTFNISAGLRVFVYFFAGGVESSVDSGLLSFVAVGTMPVRVKDVVGAAACGYVLLHTLLRIVQAQVMLLTTHYE
jgi:hypothetical protein